MKNNEREYLARVEVTNTVTNLVTLLEGLIIPGEKILSAEPISFVYPNGRGFPVPVNFISTGVAKEFSITTPSGELKVGVDLFHLQGIYRVSITERNPGSHKGHFLIFKVITKRPPGNVDFAAIFNNTVPSKQKPSSFFIPPPH